MIISILNTKGGVGKSTLSINLAVAWASDGYETLLIDTDEEGTSVAWYARREEPEDNLTVMSLLNPDALKKSISALVRKFDVIVIDGAPHLRKMLSASAWISNMIIVPVKPSPNDLWKLGPMVERLNELRAERKKKAPEICFVVNEQVERTRLSKEVAEALEAYELPVLNSRLGARMGFRDSFNQGLAAIEFDNDKAAEEINELYEEVRERLGVSG